MTRALPLTALALAGLLLAGCNGSDDPSPSTTSSSSSTTATSSTTSTTSTTAPTAEAPVKPEFPAEAEENTQAGAEAFVRYYWDAVNYAWTAPDDKILIDLAAADCEACDAIADTAANYVEGEERYSSNPLRVDLVQWSTEVSGRVHVSTNITQLASTLVSADGTVIREIAEDKGSRPFVITWNQKWTVEEIG